MHCIGCGRPALVKAWGGLSEGWVELGQAGQPGEGTGWAGQGSQAVVQSLEVAWDSGF